MEKPQNTEKITDERISVMSKTLVDAHKHPENKIIEPYLFKMYVQEIIEKKEPFPLTQSFPILQTKIRSVPSYTSMIRDIKAVCSSLGVHNEFATTEKDLHQRQFLSVLLFLPKDKTNTLRPLCKEQLKDDFWEIKTVVYINIITGDLIFKNKEHALRAHDASAYKINGHFSENESLTVYRTLTEEDFIPSE